jgi:UDP-N-acetylglucosamine 3-dehydrogenase
LPGFLKSREREDSLVKRALRVGVVGVGSMGKNHARIYHELPETELVCVADTQPELVNQVAQKYNTRGVTDYRELFRYDLDLVSIVVPTSQHKEVALAAAQAGVNILVEKPIADTLESASVIVEKCKQKKVKLMVGYVERFNPVFTVIKQQISNLNVIAISIFRLGPLPPRIKDVGVVIDMGTHDIDILRYLTNSEFRQVQSLVTSNLIGDREDSALLSFETENGILCHISTNWLTPFKVREVNIATKEKYIKGWLLDQKVCEYQVSGSQSYTVTDVPVPYGEPLKLEIQAFVDAVANDKEPPIKGEDGFKALEIALQCLKSYGKS